MKSNIQTITTLARSEIYRFLSSTFLYPDEELFALIKNEAFVKELEDCVRYLAQKGIQDLKVFFEELTLEKLQAEHRRIFGHTISEECPPYETQYGSPHIYLQTQEMGDIAGFYKAFGLEVSDKAKERIDHIGIQLEFMHFLAYKEAYAQEHHSQEKVEICREAQRKFLKEHLGRWAPLFLERLAEKAENGFYKEIAQLTEDFLAYETDFLKVELEEIREFQTVPFELEEVCALCDNLH